VSPKFVVVLVLYLMTIWWEPSKTHIFRDASQQLNLRSQNSLDGCLTGWDRVGVVHWKTECMTTEEGIHWGKRSGREAGF